MVSVVFSKSSQCISIALSAATGGTFGQGKYNRQHPLGVLAEAIELEIKMDDYS